jgi:hypothetical protein
MHQKAINLILIREWILKKITKLKIKIIKKIENFKNQQIKRKTRIKNKENNNFKINLS